MLCYDCRKEVGKGIFRCDSCINNIHKEDSKRRRALTEWESMKLGWYKNEKKWHDNISRRKVVNVNGKPTTFLTDYKGRIIKQMPRQPEHLKKAPQIYQPSYQSNSERIDK